MQCLVQGLVPCQVAGPSPHCHYVSVLYCTLLYCIVLYCIVLYCQYLARWLGPGPTSTGSLYQLPVPLSAGRQVERSSLSQ